MKTPFYIAVFMAALFAAKVTLGAEAFFHSAGVFPPDGEYVGLAGSNTLFSGGVAIRDLRLRKSTRECPPPASGETNDCGLGSQAYMDLSLDGGLTVQPVFCYARETVRAALREDGGGTLAVAVDTEMLQLELYGGDLPPNVRVRESPTRASLGRTSIRSLPDGNAAIDSFFDIFTEISLDGGQSWRPSDGSTRLELCVDAESAPPVKERDTVSLLYPPLDAYVSPPRESVAFGPNAVLAGLRLVLPSTPVPLPAPGEPPSSQTLDVTADLHLSLDGGQTFHRARCPATLTPSARHRTGSGDTRTFDTEMLALSLSGGDLPATVRIRESPTLPSPGRVSTQESPGDGYRVSSFFDVFTEISLDNGQNWIAADGPLRLALESPAEETAATTAALLESPAQLSACRSEPLAFPGGMVLRGLSCADFGDVAAFPPAGSTTVVCTATARFELSNDGGRHFLPPTNAPARIWLRLAHWRDDGDRSFFDTEMLTLSIEGGGLPVGVMLRESPTRASTGRTSLRALPGGTWQVDSFFDVFTELSVDGGRSWALQTSAPATLERTRPDDPNRIEGGIDLWTTPLNGATHMDFTNAPIPADFFGPGSQPFEGRVVFHGQPLGLPGLGLTDTIVERLCPAAPPLDGSATVPIEIVALSLVSAQPITVTYKGGGTELWDVRACLAPSNRLERGRMTILRNPCGDGGTFEATLPVRPRFIFTKASGGNASVFDAVECVDYIIACAGWSATAPQALQLARVGPGLMIDDDCDGQTPPRGPLPGCTDGFHAGLRADRGLPADCQTPALARSRLVTAACACAAHGLLAAQYAAGADADGDGIPDEADNSPFTANASQEDRDCDGAGDASDNWPDAYNPDQAPLETEVDVFPYSLARIRVQFPNQSVETIQLSGPTTVHVGIGSDGSANDTDGDGRDDVLTEMTEMTLQGISPSMGPVRVRLDPTRPTRGGMEEQANNTFRRLDVAPFTPTGVADSFFDVFFELEAMGQTFRPETHVTMETVLTHKPPATGETYTNRPTRTCAPLWPDNGAGTVDLPPAGAAYVSPDEVLMIIDGLPPGTTVVVDGVITNIGGVSRTPGGPLGGEVQNFLATLPFDMHGTGELDGFHRQVSLAVSCQTHSAPRSPGTPVQSFDTDMFRLQGQLPPGDPDFDLLRITAGTGFGLPSPGHTTLTRQPGGDWAVDSFFDITYRIDFVGAPGSVLGGRSGSTTGTIRMRAGSDCTGEDGVMLLDAQGNPTGIRLIRERHTPDPEVEIDHFADTTAAITLHTPSGASETVILHGPTRVHVWIGSAGQAEDADEDGLDQVLTEMAQLNLTGMSPTFGPVTVRLRSPTNHPFLRSMGAIEEHTNNTPGTLDVPPFTATGSADSFFDVFFEIEVGGMILHNLKPKVMQATITHKPPGTGTTYEDPQPIDLYDDNNNLTGFWISRTSHTPVPEIEVDHFPYSLARIELRLPDGSAKPVTLAGPTTVHVEIPPTGDATDSDGDGLDQVRTEMVALDLRGSHPLIGPVRVVLDPSRRTLGEIEERANNTPSTLDVAPFTAAGLADSFFDVFAELNVGGQVFRPETNISMRTVITHKPPAAGETYTNRPMPTCAPLWLDNGSGTVDLPPAGAGYVSPEEVLMIIDGLPPGTTVVIDGVITNIGGVSRTPGGPLGGEVQNFLATLPFDMHGTGELDGFHRQVSLAVSCQTHSAPRVPGTPVQSFDTDMFRLQGQLPPGDPDFDLLRITAGTEFGLPSPGHTTLTRQPGGDWAVDSFFDITYRIDFVGAPGSVLGGRSGSTTGTIRMRGGSDCGNDGVALLDSNGVDSGVRLIGERHTPNPEVEIDHFVRSLVLFQLRVAGSTQTVVLAGPVTMLARIPPDGMAADTDWNGLDQVPTDLVAMDLRGTSAAGPVRVTLNSAIPSLGTIEERTNNTPGTLDIPPFTVAGSAHSFFDIFYDIEIAGQLYRPILPTRIAGTIRHKPHADGDLQANPAPQPVAMLDAQGGQTSLQGLWDLTLLQPASDYGLLHIETLPDRTTRLSWDAPSDGAVESSTNLLNPAGWRPAYTNATVEFLDGRHVLRLTPTNEVEFFRLRGWR